MKIGAFLLGLVGPMLARILSALGMSLVTLTGLTVAVDAIKSQMTTSLNGMPLAALQFAGLCGVWTALALWLASLTFVVTWQSTKGFSALAKKA